MARPWKTHVSEEKAKMQEQLLGEYDFIMLQDRNSDFDPKVIPEYKLDIPEIEGKIISMYAKGTSTRQISDLMQV